MKINPFTLSKVGRAVPCAPQRAENFRPRKNGAHGVTPPTCLALLAAAALFAHAAFAAKPPPPPPPQPSSGTLVLDLPNASNWGLVVAPSGTIYALGNSYPDGGWDWPQLLLASGDNGSSWSLLDEYVPPGRSVDFDSDLGGGIALDSSGNLYVSGVSLDGSGQPAERYVRRSTDGGASWTTVDNMVLPYWLGPEDVGVATDAAGDVYVSGPVWATRKGVGGTSFSTVDSLSNSYAKDVFVHPSAGVFVVGKTPMTIKGQTRWVWLVRRSANGGVTWSNVDTFQLSSSEDSAAMGVGADASANLYVVGSAYVPNKSGRVAHWVVRKSANGGSSWTTVEDYQLSADSSSEAHCIATDANSNLFVAGAGGGKWILRRSAGGTGPWTTLDVFDAGVDANAIATSPSGNVFVGGGNGNSWIIKRY